MACSSLEGGRSWAASPSIAGYPSLGGYPNLAGYPNQAVRPSAMTGSSATDRPSATGQHRATGRHRAGIRAALRANGPTTVRPGACMEARRPTMIRTGVTRKDPGPRSVPIERATRSAASTDEPCDLDRSLLRRVTIRRHRAPRRTPKDEPAALGRRRPQR
jgi:hypothetical protein